MKGNLQLISVYTVFTSMGLMNGMVILFTCVKDGSVRYSVVKIVNGLGELNL